MADTMRKIPAPTPDPESAEFWAAATQGRFTLRRCRACDRAHWYPRAICPFCMSEKTEWIAASGRGTIYSYSVMRRAPIPYAIAYVTLEEGPTMVTNIVDCDFDRLAIGQDVSLVFVPTEGGPPVPMFTPAAV
jgi:uncharacterized OB-fold protein